jgi:PAS domain S-box-containing protein
MSRPISMDFGDAITITQRGGPPPDSRALALVAEVAAALSTGDPIEGLRIAAGRIAAAFGFSRAAVLALASDDDPHTLYVVAASDDASVTRMPLDLRKYPELQAAVQSHSAVFIADAEGHPLLGPHGDKAARHGGRSLFALPLLVDRRPLGCLTLRASEGHPGLAEADLSAIQLAAQVITVAIRGGRVIEAIREQTRRLSLAKYEEQRRHRALEHVRDFFESAEDGMVVVDGRGAVLYVNRAAEHLTGYARSGLQGRLLQVIVAPPQRAGLTEVLAQAASGVHLAGFDLDLVTTSGEPVRVSVSPSTAMAEHGVVVLSFRDVTLARSLEEELRKTRDFLVRLIDAAVDGIVAADMRGNVIIFNPGAERVLGYRADEVIGKIPVWSLYPDGVAGAIIAELRTADRSGARLAPSRREVRAKSGELVPVSMAASIIYEEEREVATVGIFSDLRERLRIEESLARAREQAAVAELAGATAHELNQPLTAVMGGAELLLRRLAPGDPGRSAAEVMMREAERMAEIVRKIGRITRYETRSYVGSANILDLERSTKE